MSQSVIEKNGYDHSIMGEPQLMMVQFGIALLLFTAYYAVFLVIDRNDPTLPKITTPTQKAQSNKNVPSKPSAPSSNDEQCKISSTLKIKETKIMKKEEAKREKESKQKQQRVKVPAIKTNKVSTRSFGLGRKRHKNSNNASNKLVKNTENKQQNILDSMHHFEPLQLPKSSPIISPKSTCSTSSQSVSLSPLASASNQSKKSKRKRRKKKNKMSEDLKLPSIGYNSSSNGSSTKQSVKSPKCKKKQIKNNNPPPLLSYKQKQQKNHQKNGYYEHEKKGKKKNKKRKYEYSDNQTSNKKSKSSIHIKLKPQKSPIVHAQKKSISNHWKQQKKTVENGVKLKQNLVNSSDTKSKCLKPLRPPLKLNKSNSFILTQDKLDDHQQKMQKKSPKLITENTQNQSKNAQKMTQKMTQTTTETSTKKAIKAPMQSQKIEQFEQFYEKSTDFVHISKQQISNKFHAVFDEYKQLKKQSLIDHDDEKLDPEAPAYIPHHTVPAWSSALVPGIDFMQIMQAQTSSSTQTTPSTTLATVPEEGREDIDSNASTATTSNTTTDTNANGYITTNVPLPTQHSQQQNVANLNVNGCNTALHTPKSFQYASSKSPHSPQQNFAYSMPSIQLPQLMRSNSMPDLLANPPPHPSQFQFSRSYTNLNYNTPQLQPQPQPQQTITTPITPSLSANPTLLNVANGVIPGVEAGLYWYHPQIDKSAVLLPVVINDLQHQQQTLQQQAAYASYQNAMQQIALQQQLQQK